MPIKTDSIQTGLPLFYKTDFVKTNNDSVQLFQTSDSKVVTDIFESRTNIQNIETTEENKKAKRKKWLIAAGITVGVIAIGATIAYLTKKTPTKIAGDLPETLAKIDDFDVFKNLKMCKNLSMAEKETAYKTLMRCGNKDIFLGTLSGDKPMSMLSAVKKIDDINGSPLEVLKKLDLGDDIVFVKANHWNDGCSYKFFNDYIINKKNLFNVIKNNKKLYISQLNLKKNASIKDIYKALVDFSKKNNGLPDDLLGVSLGFPKYDSMIFNLESFVSKRDRLAPDYIEKLLATFKREDFPYKNLDKKTLKTLENYIKNINQKKFENIRTTGSYYDGLYEFINFCDDTKELERIAKATTNFKETFGLI
ncbi:hypothetical protein IJD34_00280 [bacterium]|nr:hypothetical protein [bacterium]